MRYKWVRDETVKSVSDLKPGEHWIKVGDLYWLTYRGELTGDVYCAPAANKSALPAGVFLVESGCEVYRREEVKPVEFEGEVVSLCQTVLPRVFLPADRFKHGDRVRVTKLEDEQG